jgi:3-deoxy-7-phosphoheptulonate synthase
MGLGGWRHTGGDCAETFAYCNDRAIESKLKVLIQMSIVLTFGARIPLVRVLRGAGQVGARPGRPLLCPHDGRRD